MLVRFFLHSVTNCRTLSTRSLGHSGRVSEAFGGLTLPTGVMKLVDQSEPGQGGGGWCNPRP